MRVRADVRERRLPITVLVQTKNEESGIGECLDALGDFDEVIVVDSDSSDRTAEIARSRGVDVVSFTWDGRYPKKKQWQLDNVRTRHDWVLFLDADEFPTPEFVEELRAFPFSSVDVAAVEIDLAYRFAGRILRHGHRVTKRALVHRSRVRFPVVDDLDAPGMGELEGHYQPIASGRVVSLRARILHDDPDPVRTWFERHNRYSDWEAHLRENDRVRRDVARRRTLKGRVFDAVPGKPVLFFLYSAVARGGFLDGRAGIDYAIALSMYYWQIGLKTRELRRDAAGEARRADGRPLRILQVINTLAATDGGPPRNALELGHALGRTTGVTDVIVEMRSTSGATVLDADEADLQGTVVRRARRLAVRRGAMTLSLVDFARLLRAADVVILHGYYLWWLPAVAVLARVCGVPVLLTPHGTLTAYDRARKPRRKTLFDLVASVLVDPGVAAFVTGSPAERADLVRARPGRRVEVAGIGVETQEGDAPAAPVERGELHLLSVGRIAEKKRVDLMIDALAVCRERGADASLCLAGTGDPRLVRRLEQLAERRGVREHVRFLGHVGPAGKRELYRESHVFLAPSDDENFGISLAESLCHGLPAVTSDAVAAASLVEQDAVVIVPAPDGERLASAIAEIAEPERWRIAAAAARESAPRVFDWSAVAGRWLSIAESVRVRHGGR
ncbi:glycosyltransferase [Microbacterium betulae]|uniref:D-inositol 3-phosphate glycosyltransferase n=1 Tax=Microbacterium betulae TaxID=2981139 RepID=A0AA97FGJ3_9MICO|nr:glycosyltransferase [Microbacterium sp. AB]WOF22263.1 glycosyltransferase [Microbacterium sp. AB]